MQQKIQENHFEKINTACRLWRPKQLRKKRRLYDSAEDIAERLPKDNPECQKFLATLFTFSATSAANRKNYSIPMLSPNAITPL